jgi:hypothetical protein
MERSSRLWVVSRSYGWPIINLAANLVMALERYLNLDSAWSCMLYCIVEAKASLWIGEGLLPLR